MGLLNPCADFCWAVGLFGIFVFSIFAIQVNKGNESLLPDPLYKSKLTTHLILAAVVT